ncbi:MAG: NAD-dependent epimerase/dehydratase family protein [Truepera sp.]|nr:NAD-dependent epimerase/dehydratase family protein [Truepera sp.]
MKIAVTGAHGFIGSHLVERLLLAGHQVRALVSPWGVLDNLAAVLGETELVRADITSSESLAGAFDGVEVVVHAAARVAEWGPWEPFYQANVLGTERVLREAERAGVRRLVLVSSVAVHRYRGYRDADPRATPRDGDLNAYARSKVIAELLVERARLEPVIVRPGLWPFGPRDPILSRLMAALRRGPFPLVEGGRAVINTAYVGNLAEGLVLAATVPAAANRLYLIADEGAPTWHEVLAELARLLGVTPRWLMVPGWAAALLGHAVEGVWAAVRPKEAPPLSRYAAALMRRDLHFSLAAAKQELGYQPPLSWQQGLQRSVTA